MNRMKEMRKEMGLKQKDIAFITGYSKAAISLYENKKQKPSMNAAYKIAKALNTTMEELFMTHDDTN